MKTEEEIWKDVPDYKLDAIQVKTIRVCISEGLTQQKIADYFKVHRTCISAIKLGYHWNHL